jgi:hypothetical protein
MAEDAGEARAHFARALVFQPGYRGALEGIASLAHAAEDWTTSRRIYRSILSPAHPDLHRRLAEAERGLGNLEAARAEEQHFARLVAGPEQEALQAPEIVRSLLQRGPSGWESALAVSRREIARRPTIESWALLVEVHTARGEYAEAREAQLALDAVRGTIAIPSVLVPAA